MGICVPGLHVCRVPKRAFGILSTFRGYNKEYEVFEKNPFQTGKKSRKSKKRREAYVHQHCDEA